MTIGDRNPHLNPWTPASIHRPVLQALAWRLVDRKWLPEGQTFGGGEWDWIQHQLSVGPHGVPPQLASDAYVESLDLASTPLECLYAIAS
ncbi:MAG: hypothetical protein AAGG01_11235, partial [Planctomycetota bacterium]